MGKTPGEVVQSSFTQICNRRKTYNKKAEGSSNGVWKWKMSLDTFKVGTRCRFFIAMANNPLEMGLVISRNMGFGCHFSFPLSPFSNIATGKEMRIRSLKPTVPALYSLVLDSLADISSLYSAAVRIILWVIYDLINQSQQIQSLDYLLFSVCTKWMRIFSHR